MEMTLWQAARAEAPFLVCAMFTKSYLPRAERLASSLQRFGLPYEIYEVPTVHRSISAKGSDDIRYSKPRFVAEMLRRTGKPVLYLDADCVLKERPALIWDLARERMDFAVYNWLYDLMNDAWAPFDGQTRYWRFSHSLDEFSPVEMVCSGAVQYWSATPAALRLLEIWERQLLAEPTAPDDECLGYAFNFLRDPGDGLRYFWLPKNYARYRFWPYVQPVIDHPEFPNAYPMAGALVLCHSAALVKAEKARPIPRAFIIDTEEKLLLVRKADGELVSVGRVPMDLYL